MEKHDEVLEYYKLSKTYLKASLELLNDKLFEPALFNVIHALELGVKAALLTRIKNNLILHQVGGLFGREFRDTLGNDICKEINTILSKYNLPRYPGDDEVIEDDVKAITDFVEKFIQDILPDLIDFD